MKHSSQMQKSKKRKRKEQPRETEPPLNKSRRWPVWRWVLIGALGLMLAGGGTWGVLELFVWNQVPANLVGKWEVQGGPMNGGTFEFSQKGTVLIRTNNAGNDVSFTARASVRNKTLYTTTYNPETQRSETRRNIIRELTENSLILELESGEILKMVRKS